ncbi:hypothetical protein FACS1894192_11890 [Bacilli bacterium]|nr:hypothetical protein FACS1894192_11890 [Bacilli bacterium]GHU45850.1 hypothetical protein FACS1894194_2470 [Bacilli bacterium]
MVKQKWTQVRWFGLPSIRYFFLVLPSGQRVIVDHWSGFRLLYNIPFIRKYQKFDAYFIPSSEDISDWENLLVSELDMVNRGAKIAAGNFFVKLLGGGAIIGAVFAVLIALGSPIVEMCEYLHIPLSLISILISFGILILSNIISKKNIEKKIPLKNFEFYEKKIQINFKDVFMIFAQWGLVIFSLFALLLLSQHYDADAFVYITFFTWFALLGYTGIIRTANLYVNYKWMENEERK